MVPATRDLHVGAGLALFLLLILETCLASGVISDEERLLNDIFEGYDPTPRPVLDSNTTVQVFLKLQIVNVVELNTKDQFLKLRGWITVEWTNEYLRWNTSHYGNQDVVVVRPEKVWLPAFSPDNKLRGSIYDKHWFNLFRVSLYRDGTAIWEPGGLFLSECETDIAYFPFDEQICEVTFSNWVYNVKQVNLSIHEDAMRELLELYQCNSQWEVKDVEIHRRELYYACCDEPYPEIIFILHLRRKFLFYFVNLIYVSLLLAILVVITTKVPPETGERIILGVSTLLAYIIFIIVAHTYVPTTSQAVPVIVIYFVCSMFVNGIALAESAFSAHCYYRRNNRRAPAVLRAIVLGFILRLMCYPSMDPEDTNDSLIGNKKRKRTRGTKRYKKWSVWRKYEVSQPEINKHQVQSDSQSDYRGKFHRRKHSLSAGCSKITEHADDDNVFTTPVHQPEEDLYNDDVIIFKEDIQLEDINLSASSQGNDSVESMNIPDPITQSHSITLAENGCIPTTHLPTDVIASIVEQEIQRRQSLQSQKRLTSILEEEEEQESITSGSSTRRRTSSSFSQVFEEVEDIPDGEKETGSDESDIDYDYINSLIDPNQSISSAFSTAYQNSNASNLTQGSVRTSMLYHQPTLKEEKQFQQERSLIRNLNASISVTNSKVWNNLKKENPSLNLSVLQSEISRLNSWYEEQEKIRKVKREWIYIAQTLDLFFFWLLLFLYTLIIIVLLVLLPNLVATKISDKHSFV